MKRIGLNGQRRSERRQAQEGPEGKEGEHETDTVQCTLHLHVRPTTRRRRYDIYGHILQWRIVPHDTADDSHQFVSYHSEGGATFKRLDLSRCKLLSDSAGGCAVRGTNNPDAGARCGE
jgi:hypothetical protein